MEKKSFVLFVDRQKELEMLSDAQCGVLFKAIFKYVDTGERIETGDLALQILFSVFATQIDSNTQKWEETKQKRSEAGKKGMAARWNKSKPKQEITNNNNAIGAITEDNKPKQEITNITVTDTVTGTVTVSDNKTLCSTAPEGAALPTLEEKILPWDKVDFDLV